MISQWANPFTQLTPFLTTTCSGESNGSAALLATRASRATPQSTLAWRRFLLARRIRSARDRALLQTKTTVKVGVGLLPYISIASVWRRQRPVLTDVAGYRHRLHIDTSTCRTIALDDVSTGAYAIPRNSYPFGSSWSSVRRTLLVAVEGDGDPYAVLVPTAEIIRFYYAPSTRLAQALFWGDYYRDTFDAEQSGVVEEGVVKIHLRRWIEDQDAWTLARYICSPVMQREADRLYRHLQIRPRVVFRWRVRQPFKASFFL